jgi:hypothetical protein
MLAADDELTVEAAVLCQVCFVVAAMLVVLAVLTAPTGARTRVFWFKVCPVLLTTTAAGRGECRVIPSRPIRRPQR